MAASGLPSDERCQPDVLRQTLEADVALLCISTVYSYNLEARRPV